MTISVAWIRKVKDCEELVFVSDSRCAGGECWDVCPKIINFERADCALSFAGATDYTYPLMMQVRNALNQQYRIKSRAMDITDLSGHLLNQINELCKQINREKYHGDVTDYLRGTSFIFAGYSWIKKQFMIWIFRYSMSQKIFIKSLVRKNFLNIGKIAVIGDHVTRKERQKEKIKIDEKDLYVKNFLANLKNYMIQKYGSFDNFPIGFNFEPFIIIRDMLREQLETQQNGNEQYSYIGGAPQMLKIYQYMNSRPVGMYWPKKTSNVFENRTLLGRPLFDFEDTDYWFMNPDTFITKPCYKIREEKIE